ncbi:15298_t:CDS:2 [Entrophospora sp. SA101]|nr:15298_t:CDS:2 [Entrophospora sp. SA101]
MFKSNVNTIRSNDPLLQSSISRTSSPNPLNDHIRDSNNIYLLRSNSPSQPLKLEDEKSLPITIESTPIPNNDDNDIHKDWRIDATENDRHEVIANLQTDKNIRMAFVRKVYGILTLQLLTTIGVTLWFMLHEPTHTIINDNQWIFFVSMILALITLIFLFWQRKKHPFNMILLIIFTLCLSCGVASIVSLYSSKVVLQSFLITFGVFIALELFTLQTKIDFSSWKPFLYAGIWVVIFAEETISFTNNTSPIITSTDGTLAMHPKNWWQTSLLCPAYEHPSKDILSSCLLSQETTFAS